MPPSTEDRISIYDLKHPDEDEDPRLSEERSDEQISLLRSRYESTGLIGAIIYRAEDKVIEDGNTRVLMLKEKDDGSGEYEYLRILGEYQGLVYAVPENESDIDIDRASGEMNWARQNLSQASRANYLDTLINYRIIEEYGMAGHATTDILEQLNHHQNRGDKWKHPEEAKEELLMIMESLDFNAPSTAKNRIETLNEIPDKVKADWAAGHFRHEHARELNNISKKLQEGAEIPELNITLADVSDASGVNDYDKFKNIQAYDYDFLREHSNRDEYRYNDEAIYYTRDDLRLINRKLGELLGPNEPDDGPDEPEDEGYEEFKEELLDSHKESVHKIANNLGEDTEDIAQTCYEIEQDDDKNLEEQLSEAEDEINEELDQKEQLKAQRVDEYSFDNTPFVRGDDNGTFRQQDAPVVFDAEGEVLDDEEGYVLDDIEVATFFHDNVLMDRELPDDEEEFFHLIFFSPPYFDQSGTMPMGGEDYDHNWLPEGVEEISDEETLDETYDNYLDWLLERIEVFTSNLKLGRAMIINVSDFSTSGLSDPESTIETHPDAPAKRYNLPAHLSTRIEEEVDGLVYDSTIQWQKKSTSSERGGPYWTEDEDEIESGYRGYPLYYYPQDITEELLVFRKGGKPDHPSVIEEAKARFDEEIANEDEFRNSVRYEDPMEPFERNLDEIAGNFDNARRNVWKIVQQKDKEWDHDAAFPRNLAKLVVELFTLPGERVADPFAGYATVLREVQAANVQQDGPNRLGFAWENFGSEQVIKEDYREKVHEKLSYRLHLDLMDRLEMPRSF